MNFFSNKNPKLYVNEENPDNICEFLSLASQHYYNSDKELIPSGNPKTTSLIIPDKNINPYPKLSGFLKTQ